MDLVDREGYLINLGWRPVLYWPWLFKEIVKSSRDVSKIILAPMQVLFTCGGVMEA
jgi:multicomponent Na+:H+ antiporter subunit E